MDQYTSHRTHSFQDNSRPATLPHHGWKSSWFLLLLAFHCVVKTASAIFKEESVYNPCHPLNSRVYVQFLWNVLFKLSTFILKDALRETHSSPVTPFKKVPFNLFHSCHTLNFFIGKREMTVGNGFQVTEPFWNHTGVLEPMCGHLPPIVLIFGGSLETVRQQEGK